MRSPTRVPARRKTAKVPIMRLDMTEADYRRLTGRLYESYDDVPWDHVEEAWTPKKSKFQNPPGWKKPESYPGVPSAEYKAALTKGYLDLGLVDPSAFDKKKIKKLILKSVAKLLHKSNGKKAFIRDPEGVLKAVYKGQMVKDAFGADLEEVLAAIYDKKIGVKMKMSVGKTAVGWSLASAPLNEAIEILHGFFDDDTPTDVVADFIASALEGAEKTRLSPAQLAVLKVVDRHGYYVHLSGDSMEVPHGARALPRLVKLGYLTIAKTSVSRVPGEASLNVFGKQWRRGATARETRYEITDKGRKALETPG